VQEPHTFFCCKTIDVSRGRVGDLKPLSTDPPPEPAPEVVPEPVQAAAPAPVQAVPVASVPADAEEAAPTVPEAEADVSGVEAQAAEKRARRHTGGAARATVSSLEVLLRHALGEIEALKVKMTRLESMVVCLDSSSVASASSQSLGSTSSTCYPPSRSGEM